HPVKKKEANDVSEAFSFESKTIRISGKCDRNTELNDWMKKIRKNEWVAEVRLLNYKQDNAKEDGVFFLELKLK
nr:PilN domain-containing protein [Bacteroidota bacterium]